MNRQDNLRSLQCAPKIWDLVIIGGGATGLGCALDAAARGLSTVLLEAGDFASATSSRSTKLIHGGVRYLRQGNLKLVRDALRERGRLLRNAPELVSGLSFVIPAYQWWERAFYGVGLKFYDALAGSLGMGRSRILSRRETLAHLPTLSPEGLRGGVLYWDAQFDDARLALALALTASRQGAVLGNHCAVTALLKNQGHLCGVRARDSETGEEFELMAKIVLNATGVFADSIRHLDEPAAPELIAPSQGAHLVLEARFLPGQSALMLPCTDDGRVLFAIPWQGRVLLGTTDTAVDTIEREPRPRPEEIDFLLAHAARYLKPAPTRADVLSAFAGLRPLLKAGSLQTGTASLPRDHFIEASASGLITVTGGKWTTYRKMAEQGIDAAIAQAGWPRRPCATREMRLEPSAALSMPPRFEEVRRAVQQEMARTLEDVLARRSRLLFLDARAALECAPQVAHWMAVELGRTEAWELRQIARFESVASGYLPAR